MSSEFDILTKPHPWTAADWREYLRVQGREDYRRHYVSEITKDLAIADAELVSPLAELDLTRKMPDLAKEMRKEIAAQIRQDIKAQRSLIRWLEQEMDRIRPNWRDWLKSTDPRYDPRERPHAHIGDGTADGGYPPDVEARYGPFRAN
jgi:hypothetical protein